MRAETARWPVLPTLTDACRIFSCKEGSESRLEVSVSMRAGATFETCQRFPSPISLALTPSEVAGCQKSGARLGSWKLNGPAKPIETESSADRCGPACPGPSKSALTFVETVTVRCLRSTRDSPSPSESHQRVHKREME